MNQTELNAFRDEAISWSRMVLAQPARYVILDTETTGLNTKAEVVQIGIIDPTGNVLMDTLVRPLSPIPPEATFLHHITNEMVKVYPTYQTLFVQLELELKGKVVISYNADFDERILNQSGGDRTPMLNVEWVCAMETYAAFLNRWNEHYKSFQWAKLEGGDHSALGDCEATLGVIKLMAAAQLSTEMAPLLSSPADPPDTR